MKDLDLSLYLVLDPDLCGGARGMVETAIKAVSGGCRIVQLRCPGWKKRAMAECGRELVGVLSAFRVPLIVDDHLDVAAAIGAAGVHVGQKDLQPDDARQLLGPRAVIGYSVSTMEQLEAAKPLAASGCVDYLGTGPIETTATKPDAEAPLGVAGFAEIAAVKPCPIVAIGSVTVRNARALAEAGADGIAVVSAICGKADPKAEAEALLKAFRGQNMN